MGKRSDKSGNCALCGIWRSVLCRDHRVPRRDGGRDDPSNIQMICANCHQDKTATEQSAAHKGRPKTPEQRAKMSAWQIGRPKSEITKQRIRDTLRGRKDSPETIARKSAAAIGRIVSIETREKLKTVHTAKSLARTHCRSGHLFDEANTIWDKKGRRRCRACYVAHLDYLKNYKKMQRQLPETAEQREARLAQKRRSYSRNREADLLRSKRRYQLRKQKKKADENQMNLELTSPIIAAVPG